MKCLVNACSLLGRPVILKSERQSKFDSLPLGQALTHFMPANKRKSPLAGSPDSGESEKARRPARRRPSTREKLVRKALRLIERRMDRGEINSSLGDLIRLLELAEEKGREPKSAGWVPADWERDAGTD